MKKKVFGVGIQVLIQIACLFPWIWIGNDKFNAITYLWHGLGGKVPSGEDTASLFVSSGIILLMQILSLVQIVMILKKRYIRVLDVIIVTGSVVVMMGAGNLLPQGGFFDAHIEKADMGYQAVLIFYSAVLMLLCAVSFFGNYLFEVWKDTMAQYHTMKKEQKEYEEARRRRLYFPGKYDKTFFRMLFKLFRKNKRDFILFAVSSALCLSMVFAGVGMAEMLMPYEKVGNYMNGHGIYSIIWGFVGVSGVMTALLVTLNLLSYLQKRMRDYNMLLSLGMRERTMHKAVFAEVFGCMGATLVGAFGIGGILLVIIRHIFAGKPEIAGNLGHAGIITVLGSLAFAIGVFMVAIAIVRDFLFVSSSALKKQFVQGAEKMPGKKRIFVAVLGLYIVFLSVVRMHAVAYGEQIYHFFMLALGLYLILRNALAIWLLAKRKKEGQGYYNKLLLRNRWYYRFKTNTRVTVFCMMVPVVIMVIYGKSFFPSMLHQSEKELFPYDFQVMIRQEEGETVQKIAEKYHGKAWILPAKRVTTAQNTPKPKNIMENILPQGQNIGISYSTYKQLCKAVGVEPKKVNLKKDGSNILLVYQQDVTAKMHPIDYYLYAANPYIHIGLPVLSCNGINREDLYPQRKIAAHQVKALTGAYLNGLQENLIVFHDEYFEKHRMDDADTNFLTGEKITSVEELSYVYPASDTMALLTIPKEHQKEVRIALKEIEKAHPMEIEFDRDIKTVYDSGDSKGQHSAEHWLNRMVNLFTMAAMLVISFAALYLKVEGEVQEKKERSDFLENIGMRKKDRVSLLKKEFFIYIWIPLAAGGILGVWMTWVVWQLRDYTTKQCLQYAKPLGITAVIVYGIWILGVKMMEYFVVKKVEGGKEA